MKTLFIFTITVISTEIYCQNQELDSNHKTFNYSNPTLKKVSFTSSVVLRNFKSKSKGRGTLNNLGPTSLDNQSEFKFSKKKFALEMSVVNQRRAQLDFKRFGFFIGNNGRGNTTRNDGGVVYKLLWNHWKPR